MIASSKGYRPLACAVLLVGVSASSVMSDDGDRCASITKSIEAAGFGDSVSVHCENGHAHIHSDTYPDHDMMNGITGTNEQIPVPAKDHDAPIPLEPALGDTPQTRDAALGVAVNGVPIYDYTAGGEMTLEDLHHHQTRHDTLLLKQLDNCGGHAGRGDDYHYHAKPTCMIEQMENAGDDAIIGWAYDGFPIYGDNNPDGTAIVEGLLDVCNGQADEAFGYRYHTSQDAPYIIQCLMGEVENMRDLPRVPPLKSASGWLGSRDSGVPPRGGVENLTFSETEVGTRSLEYTYQGEQYFIRYSPTDKENCYAFTARTVTEGGETKTGEYCR